MRKLILLLCCCEILFCQSAADRATPQPERHEFVISNFHTESGVTMPKVRVVYGTYGHLNSARDNAVLMPSHYMANLHGYEWLIGSDRALDPSQLFLIATELFGNGSSSSPSNTPEPYHGPRFPVMTIRDNVEGAPPAHRGPQYHALARDRRLLDGR
jgi:homoserine O-acetyltransferase/O-succinyltransferase